MTEREALIRAILERPDDDLPRLVFADWLEENGEDTEAKRIRWEIANPDHREWVPHYGNHTRRMWIMHSRGFVGGLRTGTNTFMDQAAWFFRRHPITHVEMTDVRTSAVSSVNLEALSAACVAYGRKLAELPPLEIASPSHAFR